MTCSPAWSSPTINLENKKNTTCLEQCTSKLTYCKGETNVDWQNTTPQDNKNAFRWVQIDFQMWETCKLVGCVFILMLLESGLLKWWIRIFEIEIKKIWPGLHHLFILETERSDMVLKNDMCFMLQNWGKIVEKRQYVK